MRTPDQALAWLEQQRASGSTAWYNMCESLCRQSYGLPAHYSSAELHANAVPSSFRHGHETPSKGDLVLYKNGGYGHIVVATGNGWECYTNDYGGRGKVTKTDARNLVSWCGATSWFVADAWWSSSNYIRTHGGDDDMPLDDADIDKIARRVWQYKNESVTSEQAYWHLVNSEKKVWDHQIKSLWDGTVKSAAALLNQSVFYSLLGGVLGKVPATAQSSANSDTTSQRIYAAASTDSGGSGGATAQQIADATANEIADRMKA